MTLRRLAPAAILLSFLTSATFFFALHAIEFFRLDDVGYGDSYILFDVLHLRQTGEIYRDLSKPPYLPAQYSPLVYRMYALPGMLGPANPFLGPRLVAGLCFIGCVLLSASLARALVPRPSSWLWGIAVAASFRSMEVWPLQLRGDFAGCLFGLAAIRLLLARFPYAALAAGFCAGFATQFKFTFIAAIAAGALWLLVNRLWWKLGLFVAGSAVASLGLYSIFFIREPRMLAQMFALSPGVWKPLGSFDFALTSLGEPAVLIAVAGLPVAFLHRSRPSRWLLLLLYTASSFLLGIFLDMQAGGNINYFFEALFSLTPLAVLGILQLSEWSAKDRGIAVFLAGLATFGFFFGQLSDIYNKRERLKISQARRDNDAFRRTAAFLNGRHFLSLSPRLALLDPQPPLVEPYLMAYEMREGKLDGAPLLERVRASEFDFVIEPKEALFWRGIPHVDEQLLQAIRAHYEPYCEWGGNRYELPRARNADDEILRQLRELGCAPLSTISPCFSGSSPGAYSSGTCLTVSFDRPESPQSGREHKGDASGGEKGTRQKPK